MSCVDGDQSPVLAVPHDLEPVFPAEWAAMDPAEYAARFLDPPERILDAEPEDGLPEEIRAGWQLAEAEAMIEAELMPDPLSDPPGPAAGRLPCRAGRRRAG